MLSFLRLLVEVSRIIFSITRRELELSNDFFLFKADELDSIDRALTEGPYVE